jgi:methylthioribose-1-phosphate isomerase
LQGANLTAWELRQRGIPHSLFVDSASGLLMQRREVDIILVGADRVARNGDVCNKIGTYDKALAAADNGVPFYVALPSPTLDPALPPAPRFRSRLASPTRSSRSLAAMNTATRQR